MAAKPSKSRAGGERLELDGFIPYRLSVMQQEVSRAISAVYADKYGLMRYDWRVMAALGDDQPLSANQVCERTNMDKVQVSRAIARLKENGLVDQDQDVLDRRRSRLRLTRRGQAMYRDIVPAALAREAELLAVFSVVELQQLERLVEKLYLRARELNTGKA